MRIRHLLAAAPVALLVLTGCSDSGDPAPAGPDATTSAADAAALDEAVAQMCLQVDAFLDSSEVQADTSGQPFDRAARGQEFLDQLKGSSAAWVSAYNAQAEATGAEQLDPETATWEDMPAQTRELIEASVTTAVSGTC